MVNMTGRKDIRGDVAFDEENRIMYPGKHN